MAHLTTPPPHLTRSRLLWLQVLVCLCVAMAVPGCKDLEQAVVGGALAPSEPEGDRPLTSIEGFDHEDLLRRLQGDWIVERNGSRIFEFHIDGERASAVDHRFATARPLSGELVLRSPTGFGIATDDVTYFFSFVQTGGVTYMGMGGAIHGTGHDPFVAKLGAWERLERGPEGCTYVNTFGAEPVERASRCELTKRGDREVFTFQAPDPFRPDKLRTMELNVAGDYLLERDLAESVARPMGAPARRAASQPAPGAGPAEGDPVAKPTNPAAAGPPSAPQPGGHAAPAPEAAAPLRAVLERSAPSRPPLRRPTLGSPDPAGLGGAVLPAPGDEGGPAESPERPRRADALETSDTP